MLGEQIACDYLKSKRYSIIDRNFRKPWGEIDIIARDRDGTLVFVEVKTMVSSEFLKPEDNATSAKLRKMKVAASLYAGKYPGLVSDKAGWRIDLIAIPIPEELAEQGTLTRQDKDVLYKGLVHYENVG